MLINEVSEVFQQMGHPFVFDSYIWEKCVHMNESLSSRNIPLGITYLTLGIIYQALYAPCLLIIAEKTNLRYSCFKIMFVIGLTDVAILNVNTMMSGFYSIVGGTWCDYPISMSIAGHLGYGLWCSYCVLCVFLNLNRILDILDQNLKRFLFGRKKTWYYMTLPVLYGGYFAIFEPPLIYSSRYGAWLFAIDPGGDKVINVTHNIHNIGYCVVTVLLYVILCCILFKLSHKSMLHRRKLSTLRTKILIQSCLICFIALLASLTYVITQYIDANEAIFIFSQVSWQACHGCLAIIYWTFNENIQSKLFPKGRVSSRFSYLNPFRMHYSNAGLIEAPETADRTITQMENEESSTESSDFRRNLEPSSNAVESEEETVEVPLIFIEKKLNHINIMEVSTTV
ncbi:hypothetical protein AB6A40_004755 [Gnathostoma spinigerum]|uniref:Opsin n=1 Tax=Gnathostoma spinigerum TaxID=75299 RepID=A0ABD6EFR5_9BILA